MAKRLIFAVLVLVLVAGISLAGEKEKAGKEFIGWVSDTHCAAKGDKGANDKHGGCATSCVKNRGAKYALVTPSDGKVYTLDPQDTVAAHAGHHVKVTGTVEGDTLKVESIEMTGEQKGGEKKQTP